MSYYQILMLRFVKLWLEKRVLAISNESIWDEATQLHKEVSALLKPRLYREIEK